MICILRADPFTTFRSSDFDSELFEILIVLNVGIHRLTDELSAFLAVLLHPFRVFIFDALDLFLLVVIYISMGLGLEEDEQMLTGRRKEDLHAGGV